MNTDLDFNSYIGGRIRKKRKQMGISLQQLADLLKLSCQQVQKYESGASKISADRLALIAHILNEPIDFFYRDVDFDSITIGDKVAPSVITTTRQEDLELMLVEDNPTDAILFREAVKKLDFIGEVVIEHNANNVLPYLLNHHKNPNHRVPDVLFLDLTLPSGNGFDLLKKIKEDRSLQHMVVVVLSGSIDWEDMMKSYRMGAASYILKSSKEKGLVELLGDVMNYWARAVVLPKAA